MWPYLAKVALTAMVVVAVAEVGKRSSFWGAVLASLPLTSLLAFVWLYLDTGDAQKVAALAHGIFWLVLPSLPLFLVLPALLRHGCGFWPSLGLSSLATVGAYFAMAWTMARLGLRVT